MELCSARYFELRDPIDVQVVDSAVWGVQGVNTDTKIEKVIQDVSHR
jgi:hypothetical protein